MYIEFLVLLKYNEIQVYGGDTMIKFEDYIIPAAALGKENPMPDIKNVSYIHAGYKMTDKIGKDELPYIGKGMIQTMLPYKMQDGYDRNKKEKAFRAAIVENSHLKAVFLPEVGGRLWSLYDKEKQRELLYVNPVFQPANLALRNAWFSGGVEFNVGIKGHNPLTCSPMWCAVDTCEEGDVLRLYEYERIRGVVYSINVWLPEDSPVLYIKGRIENTSNETKHMYWWSNIAVPETKETRIFVPTDESFLSFYNENSYVLDKASIPLHEGLDVTYPSGIPSSRDFFYKIPEKSHKWIATADKDGNGLLQCSTQMLKGRKLFVWGQGQGGRNWNEWLSEEGSAYIEIQAGLAHTQLEHIPMEGNSAWEWTEAYTALELSPEVAHGDYTRATAQIESYISSRIGNPDLLPFPKQSNAKASSIICSGSAWGAVEEAVRGKRLSDICEFRETDDSEAEEWLTLLKRGMFSEPETDEEPKSYVMGEFWLKRLESLPNQSWYSLLHTGIIKYAAQDIAGAKEAFEQSIAQTPSSWAYRNLAMLYKNELGNIPFAKNCILKAFELKQNCPSLCCEVAAVLIESNENEMWLNIYGTLSDSVKSLGRIQLYRVLSLMRLNRLREAADILTPTFTMNDIKEGELSVSQLWFELYRRLYAEENGMEYSAQNTQLLKDADKKYPLPKRLDFRMHD